MIGSAAVQFTLIWWIASETDSALMLGLAGLAAYLPMLFLGPLAGVLADRLNRKLICICSDMFTGLTAVIFAIFIRNGEIDNRMVLLVLFVRGLSSTFQSPALQAIIPQLVPPEDLVKANGWTRMLVSGSFMLGPVLGGLMYANLPLPMILLTDLLGAIVASIMLAIVHVPQLAMAKREKSRFWGEWREGIRVFRDDRILMRLMIIDASCMIFIQPIASFYPLMTSSYFNLGPSHGSAVDAAYAVGMMLSAILLSSVVKVKNKINTALIGMLGIGFVMNIGGMMPPVMWGWWVFLIMCGLMGAFANVYGIPFVAYMQEAVPQEKMGRVFSVLGMESSVTMPLGLLLASPIADRVGVHVWFMISGLAVVCITLVGFRFVTNKAAQRQVQP